MRSIQLATATLGLLLVGRAVFGMPFNCKHMKTEDDKNYCLSIQEHKKSYCNLIGDQDRKNDCLAMSERSVTYCHEIEAQDKRKQCLTKMGQSG